jgi:peptidoglycan/xylan/chitin deacetylase (PgdA/CDA1 family)
MRLAAAACALAIVVCLAVFGAVLAQRATAPVVTSAPAVPVQKSVSTPASSPVSTIASTSVSTEQASSSTTPPSSSTTVGASTPLVVAAANTTPIAVPTAVPVPLTADATPNQPTSTSQPVNCPGNPNAIGVARTVEIDTTGGPGFGFEQYKSYDFLQAGEVVLTFDDGPWPGNTPKVLAALAHHCTKAIFFPIGLHATYEPQLLKEVAAAGHTIGSHTWCHQDLSKTKGKCNVNGKTQAVEYNFKDEIEKGISAVHWAVGGPTAPFFRFPALRQPPEAITYLGQRNIAIFSADFDTQDFKMRRPEEVRRSVAEKLKKNGKGIILMHDFQHATADAIGDILNDMKAGGYKVVWVKPKFPVTTVASYDDEVAKAIGPTGGDHRPVGDVVRTVQ